MLNLNLEFIVKSVVARNLSFKKKLPVLMLQSELLLHRGFYMSAHVLLNSLNKLR